MRYYIKAFKNYFDPEGRANRKEIWLFYLFHYLFVFILSFLDELLGLYSTKIPLDYGYLTLAYLLVSLCPTICLQIRRFHDVDKSGNWWFANRVPILNFFTLYLLFFKAGTEGENKYGLPSEKVTAKDTKNVPFEPPTATSAAVGPALTIESRTDTVQELPQNISTPIKPRANFCRNCGARLIYGGRFCSECGTEVVD